MGQEGRERKVGASEQNVAGGYVILGEQLDGYHRCPSSVIRVTEFEGCELRSGMQSFVSFVLIFRFMM